MKLFICAAFTSQVLASDTAAIPGMAPATTTASPETEGSGADDTDVIEVDFGTTAASTTASTTAATTSAPEVTEAPVKEEIAIAVDVPLDIDLANTSEDDKKLYEAQLADDMSDDFAALNPYGTDGNTEVDVNIVAASRRRRSVRRSAGGAVAKVNVTYSPAPGAVVTETPAVTNLAADFAQATKTSLASSSLVDTAALANISVDVTTPEDAAAPAQPKECCKEYILERNNDLEIYTYDEDKAEWAISLSSGPFSKNPQLNSGAFLAFDTYRNFCTALNDKTKCLDELSWSCNGETSLPLSVGCRAQSNTVTLAASQSAAPPATSVSCCDAMRVTVGYNPPFFMYAEDQHKWIGGGFAMQTHENKYLIINRENERTKLAVTADDIYCYFGPDYQHGTCPTSITSTWRCARFDSFVNLPVQVDCISP